MFVGITLKDRIYQVGQQPRALANKATQGLLLQTTLAIGSCKYPVNYHSVFSDDTVKF